MAPSISTASRLVVPSISASPLMSSVAASSSPVMVMLRPPVRSLSESTMTALEAETVPAVMPSTRFSSAAVEVTAVPLMDNPPVTSSVLAAVIFSPEFVVVKVR